MDRTLRDELSISNEIKAVTLVHIGMSSDFWWKVSTECISVIAQAWWEYCDGLSVVCRHFQLLLVSLKSLSIYVGFVSSKDVSNTLKLDWKSFSFPFHCFFITWFSLSFYFFPFPFFKKKPKQNRVAMCEDQGSFSVTLILRNFKLISAPWFCTL